MLMKRNIYLRCYLVLLVSGFAAEGNFQSVLSGTFDWTSIDAVDGSIMLGISGSSGMVIEGNKLFEVDMAFETVCFSSEESRWRQRYQGRLRDHLSRVRFQDVSLLERKAGDIAKKRSAKGRWHSDDSWRYEQA